VAGRLRLAGQIAAIGLVAALLALLVWKTVRDEGGAADALSRGEHPVAPAWSLPRLDRPAQLSLASLRGKGVVLNFWASWCIPCKDEAPVLEQAWRKHRRAGLVVVGVNVEDFDADARRFMQRYGLTYPNVEDEKKSLIGRYGVRGYPETFFVDRRGRLVGERISGGIDAGDNPERFDRGIALVLRQ
jgi:cytochrome c biogenesis protein CcmG, thiol:disulfide interchange protein DsbE